MTPVDVVVDSSAVVRALRPGDPAAVRWMDFVRQDHVRALVPDLIYAETASALVKYLRHGEIEVSEADDAMASLLELPLEAHSLRLLGRQALALSLMRRISAYDACYLALAIGYDAVLVTADRRLAGEAARPALLPHDHPPSG